MLRRTLVVLTTLAVLSVTTSASAAPTPIRGRSVRTQAALDAQVAEDATSAGSGPVQILTQLCGRPWKLRGCEAMPAKLQAALDDAIGGRITWVERRQMRGPEFLVFAPVRIARDAARTEVAWWDPGRSGCRGGSTLEFARDRGAWVASRGLGWAVCSASG